MKNFSKEGGIIAHGDGDGLISAAVLQRAGAVGELTLTQPFLLEKLPDLNGLTIVIDIAVNNRNPEGTLDWVRRNADKIVLWVDHHQGTEVLVDILGEKLSHDSGQPSCPALLKASGYDVSEEWLLAANACDRPVDYPPTPLSERINAAFKVALVELQDGDRSAVDRVQKACVNELVSGESDPLVEDYASRYTPLLEATERVAENLREVAPDVVATTLTNERVDKTVLFQKGYRIASIVILQHVSLEDGSEVTTVATSQKHLNLVEMIGFKSGAPFRVTIGADQVKGHSEQLKLVVEKIKKEKKFYASFYSGEQKICFFAGSDQDAFGKVLNAYPSHKETDGEDIEMVVSEEDLLACSDYKPEEFKEVEI